MGKNLVEVEMARKSKSRFSIVVARRRQFFYKNFNRARFASTSVLRSAEPIPKLPPRVPKPKAEPHTAVRPFRPVVLICESSLPFMIDDCGVLFVKGYIDDYLSGDDDQIF